MKRTTSREIEPTVQVNDTGKETIHADAEVMPMTNDVTEMMDNDIETTAKTGDEGGAIYTTMLTKGNGTIAVTGNGGKVPKSMGDK